MAKSSIIYRDTNLPCGLAEKDLSGLFGSDFFLTLSPVGVFSPQRGHLHVGSVYGVMNEVKYCTSLAFPGAVVSKCWGPCLKSPSLFLA